MKDIDFDELDKAVGSVLGTTGSPADSTATATDTATPAPATESAAPASTPTTTSAPVAPEEAASVENKSEAESVTVSTPQIKTVASPARKRGQFLDMVHPSANMRKSSPLPSGSRKTIVPLGTNITPDPTPAPIEKTEVEEPESAIPVTTAVSEPVATPLPVTLTEPVEAKEDSENNEKPQESRAWPDPLDFATGLAQPEQQKDDVDSKVEENIVPSEPAQTPFVADAKVDKRPLGAFAAPEEVSETNGSNEKAAEAPAEENAATDPGPAVEDPSAPEYNADVNMVEATGVPQDEGALADETKVPTVAAPEAEKPVEEPAPIAAQPTPQPEVSHEAAPTVATSIPQQYQTPEKKDDDAEHHLFDTEEYHQPLLPDGKKKKGKKGLLIVLLLVALLIIGGVLGYFAYTMGV